MVIPAGNEVTRSVSRIPSGESWCWVHVNVRWKFQYAMITNLKTQAREGSNRRNVPDTETVSPANTCSNVDFLLYGKVGDLHSNSGHYTIKDTRDGLSTYHSHRLRVSGCPCWSKVRYNHWVWANRRGIQRIGCRENRWLWRKCWSRERSEIIV